MLQQISIQDTRNNLASLVNQTALTGRQFIITKFGKPSAMLVPVIVEDIDEKNVALEAAFGIWENRKDIKNTAKWVEALRTKMSFRTRE